MNEILFSAQVGPWVCVKKQKIEDGVEKVEVSRALASIHDSMHRKIWDFLTDDFKLEELGRIAAEVAGAEYNEKKKKWMVKGRLSGEQIATALKKLNSPSTTRQIKETGVVGKNGLEIAKSYVTRRALDLLGFRLELNPKVVDKYLEEKNKLEAGP